MALGTNHRTTTTQDVFIPELWSDEVIANYKANLVIASKFTQMNHSGKKGDVINLPKPARGAANAKVAETQVTLNTDTATNIALSINKHYEYSQVFEDIAAIQGIDSQRNYYTDDAGYALATQIDSDCRDLAAVWNGSTAYSTAVIGSNGSTVWDPTASTNTGNGAALADAGVRRMGRTLDELNVPMVGRCWVVPPVEKESLLGIARFTEQAFVGDAFKGQSAIRTGIVGDLYGSEVFVSTNCATITATDTTTDYRVGLYFHKGVAALITQLDIRSQAQYKLEYLGDLLVVDTIYGVGNLRTDNGLAFVVPV